MGILKDLFQSFTKDGRLIVGTVALGFVAVYIFSYVVFSFFQDDFVLETEKIVIRKQSKKDGRNILRMH